MTRIFLFLVALLPAAVMAFVPHQAPKMPQILAQQSPASTTALAMAESEEDRMKKIMQEEAMNPNNMKMAGEQLKNLKPEDLDAVLRDMDNMPAAQLEQMKAMGMNPDLMRQSLQMMKLNPNMAKEMAKMMETMSPEELMAKSKEAQERMAASGFAAPISTPAPKIVDAQVTSKQKQEDNDDEEDDEPIPEPDAEVLDAMFKTAELMSTPPSGGVTFAGFSCIPPIALLVDEDTEKDLSKKELGECWADGSLGSTRVDRKGFERVWMEVQEYFTVEIMEKSRERTVAAKAKRGASKSTTITPAAASSSTPTVGANIAPEVLEKQVKNMSDADLDAMLDQMKSMTPEQEARMKAMGVDPAMMQKTANVLKGNPMMKNAAKMMMKTMTPEQMKSMSAKAQEEMKNMSPEDYQKMLDQIEKAK